MVFEQKEEDVIASLGVPVVPNKGTAGHLRHAVDDTVGAQG